jgi:hypothetical protein
MDMVVSLDALQDAGEQNASALPRSRETVLRKGRSRRRFRFWT